MTLRRSISVYSADTDDVGASKLRGNGNGLAMKEDEERQVTERGVCQYGQIHTHTHTHTHIHIHTHTHMQTYIHTYTHTGTHIHTHTYI